MQKGKQLVGRKRLKTHRQGMHSVRTRRKGNRSQRAEPPFNATNEGNAMGLRGFWIMYLLLYNGDKCSNPVHPRIYTTETCIEIYIYIYIYIYIQKRKITVHVTPVKSVLGQNDVKKQSQYMQACLHAIIFLLKFRGKSFHLAGKTSEGKHWRCF